MSKKLPQNPSVEYLKKQAKKYLKGLRAGEPSALEAFRAIRRFSGLSDGQLTKAEAKLADAQYAVALEYGFESWRRLASHVAGSAGGAEKWSSAIDRRFSELQYLDNRAVQRLLREVDSSMLAAAMRGADEGLRQKIFTNMSRYAGLLLQEDIDSLAARAHPAAVHQMRGMILNIQDALLKKGEISAAKGPGEQKARQSDPVASLKRSGRLDRYSAEELKTLFYELSLKARDRGLLALEADAGAMDDDLISKGLNLVVDGTAPNLIDKLLRSRLEKKIREVKARYEAAIEALLAIQAGDHPRMIRERMDSTLS
jgi:hypothetical protein